MKWSNIEQGFPFTVLNVRKCPCRKVLKKPPVSQLSSKSSPSNQEWHLYSVGWSSWWGWLFTSPHSKYKTFSLKKNISPVTKLLLMIEYLFELQGRGGAQVATKVWSWPGPIFIQVHIYGAYIYAPFSDGQGAKKLVLKLMLKDYCDIFIQAHNKLKDLDQRDFRAFWYFHENKKIILAKQTKLN